MNDKQLAKAYKQLDKDGSGTIELSEFDSWWRGQKEKARQRLEGKSGQISDENDKLQSVWKAADKDGSGALDMAELKEVFVQMGQNLNDKQLAKVAKTLDKDGSGTIEFSEFSEWWKAQKEKAKQRLQQQQQQVAQAPAARVSAAAPPRVMNSFE